MNWIQDIGFIATQLLLEVLREAARAGKSIEELLGSATEQTEANEAKANEMLQRFQAEQLVTALQGLAEERGIVDLRELIDQIDVSVAEHVARSKTAR